MRSTGEASRREQHETLNKFKMYEAQDLTFNITPPSLPPLCTKGRSGGVNFGLSV